MALAVQGNLTLYIKDRFDHDNYKFKYNQGRPLLSYAVIPQHLHALVDHVRSYWFGSDQADPHLTGLLLMHGANPNEIYKRTGNLYPEDEPSIWGCSLAWAW